MKNYDVIVIGAGNGGLSAAAELSISGKKVLVLEKHNIPGGCGTSFRRGRFEFEVALHQLSQMGTPEKKGQLREIFEHYGILDKIDWIEIGTLYKVNLPGGEGISIPANRKEAEKTLIARFPEEKDAILKYFEMVYAFSKESSEFAQKSSGSKGEPSAVKKLITKALFPKLYPNLAKYGLRSTEDVLNEFFKSKELQLCLSVYWCFMGMSPERFPFSILARCTALYIEDKPFYLRGGSQMISQALADVIVANGGEIKYNSAAVEISIEKGTAVGVIDSNGEEYKTKKIISNISPEITYGKLIKKENLPQAAVEYLKPYTVGISSVVAFFGLDCTPEEIGFTDSFNLIYENLDANKSFEEAYKLLPETDPMVATCYTVDDPLVSPEGTSIITAGSLKYGTPWENLSPDEYYEMKYKAEEIIVERLEKRFPGFREHIEEVEIATPLTFMRYLGHPGGAIYGYEQDLKSSVFFFPRDTFIKNLTFASGWVNICGFGPNYIYGNTIAKEMAEEI